jgi:ferrous iron transport protein A
MDNRNFGQISGQTLQVQLQGEIQMKTLDEMKPGSEGRIKRLSVRDKLGQRLVDMGIYPGLRLKVIRNAPLKDPMEVELDGYFVSLRHDEARFVEVETT